MVSFIACVLCIRMEIFPTLKKSIIRFFFHQNWLNYVDIWAHYHHFHVSFVRFSFLKKWRTFSILNYYITHRIASLFYISRHFFSLTNFFTVNLTLTESSGYMTQCSIIPAIAPVKGIFEGFFFVASKGFFYWPAVILALILDTGSCS